MRTGWFPPNRGFFDSGLRSISLPVCSTPVKLSHSVGVFSWSRKNWINIQEINTRIPVNRYKLSNWLPQLARHWNLCGPDHEIGASCPAASPPYCKGSTADPTRSIRAARSLVPTTMIFCLVSGGSSGESVFHAPQNIREGLYLQGEAEDQREGETGGESRQG